MQEITEEQFQQEVLNYEGRVVVDFYTDWCNPCKQLAPILEELSKEMGAIKFVKVNAEKASTIASQYGVRSVPTLAIIEKGQVKDTITGLHPKEALKEKLTL